MADSHATELQKETDRINKFYDDEAIRIAGNKKLEEMTDEEQAQYAYALSVNATNREKELADAKLREQKRFYDEKEVIESSDIANTKTKDQLALARINKRYDDEIRALKQKFSKEIQATKAFQKTIDLINKQRQAEIDDSGKHGKKKLITTAVSAAQEVVDAGFTIASEGRKADLDQKISALETQKEAELNVGNLTQAQKKTINDKYAAMEREEKLKSWEADKAAHAAQILIDGAAAAIRTYVNKRFTFSSTIWY